jgi:hypothetical protein
MHYALLPVKDLTQAKVRLSPLLSPVQRYTLASPMLDDVLTAVRQASTLTARPGDDEPHAPAPAAQWGWRWSMKDRDGVRPAPSN